MALKEGDQAPEGDLPRAGQERRRDANARGNPEGLQEAPGKR